MENNFDLKNEFEKLRTKFLELAEQNAKMRVQLDQMKAQLELNENRKRKLKLPTGK